MTLLFLVITRTNVRVIAIINIFRTIGGELMERAYKYRIYPTAKQIEIINQIFGSWRFVYAVCAALRMWLQKTLKYVNGRARIVEQAMIEILIY